MSSASQSRYRSLSNDLSSPLTSSTTIGHRTIRSVKTEIEAPPQHATPWSSIIYLGLLIFISVAISALAIIDPGHFLRSRAQFVEFYPQFGTAFHNIARNLCDTEYQLYRHGTVKNVEVNKTIGGEPATRFVQPMINCMLEHSAEYIKYSLGSSQVMLGLTPTILALLGASSEEVCLLALIGQRRILAFGLAIASPSIYTNRAFEYRNHGEIISSRLDLKHVNHTLRPWHRRLIILVEYIFLGFALANVAELAYELGMRSIQGVNPNTIWMVMLWSILALPAHLAGAVVFSLKTKRVEAHEAARLPSHDGSPRFSLAPSPKVASQRSGLIAKVSYCGRWMLRAVRRELWLDSSLNASTAIYVQSYKETKLFIASAWLLSVLIVFHIVLGTLIFSSTNFVGPRDALGVMARYIVSVIICRVILVYELAVVRVWYKNGLEKGNVLEEDNQTKLIEHDRENRLGLFFFEHETSKGEK